MSQTSVLISFKCQGPISQQIISPKSGIVFAFDQKSLSPPTRLYRRCLTRDLNTAGTHTFGSSDAIDSLIAAKETIPLEPNDPRETASQNVSGPWRILDFSYLISSIVV